MCALLLMCSELRPGAASASITVRDAPRRSFEQLSVARCKRQVEIELLNDQLGCDDPLDSPVIACALQADDAAHAKPHRRIARVARDQQYGGRSGRWPRGPGCRNRVVVGWAIGDLEIVVPQSGCAHFSCGSYGKPPYPPLSVGQVSIPASCPVSIQSSYPRCWAVRPHNPTLARNTPSPANEGM
jgi:hypothetical protein